MERRSPGASSTSSGMSVEGRSPTMGHSSRPNPDYTSAIVREALETLASIDLVDLCNEAKIEPCRATRDLSSCGRYVQHVLVSCGHASLCGECSQRCDVCPICRTPVPRTGAKLRLRLYSKCIEAGLISKHDEDKFQEKSGHGAKHVMADVHRLYSFFDVALENSLVSLICHYVTDVCMDENAVSSDPVHAFLLDEVVVKDWCRHKFTAIVTELSNLYLRQSELNFHVTSMSKLVFQLGGLSNVLEVLLSSTAHTASANLNDLHHFLDNTLKVKQHLEVTIWCIKHGYLKDVQSRHTDYISWISQVRDRKAAAAARAWPDVNERSVQHDGSTLFIEDALTNLGIEKESEDGFEGLGLSCLQEDKFASPALSCMDYPFRNLRAATDVLFLRGTSDMMVAKQAIFLYYLFDRHWTMSDEKWRHIIDDFAASFGISRYLVLESLVFYLLDDHTDEALQTAASILPEIASPESHPKIAQVLLQRQRPETALMVLRCSGCDGISGYANDRHEATQVTSLAEAVTAVRVRIECGLLTAAFMYLRSHCSKVKKEETKPESSAAASNNCKNQGDSLYQAEVLVSELCALCIRRNLVERMIELPWNADEEKYLCKCLYENATQNPLGISGSLLVVFYLQRYRYTEAYHIDQKLRELEGNMSNTNKVEASQKQQISQWRISLVEKAIELLPETQRLQVKATKFDILGLFSSQSADNHPVNACTNVDSSNNTTGLNLTVDSVVLQSTTFLRKEVETDNRKICSVSPTGSGSSQGAPTAPLVFPGNMFDSQGSPNSYSRTGPMFNVDLPGISCNGNGSASNGVKARSTRLRNGIWQELSSLTPVTFRKGAPLAVLSSGIDMDSVPRTGKKDFHLQGSSRRGGVRWRTDEADDDEEMDMEFEQKFSSREGSFRTPKGRYGVR